MIRKLDLPMPPSTNHLYPSLPNGRRVKSKEAQAYQQEISYAILAQWGLRRWQGQGVWDPYEGRVAIGWGIYADGRRDIDNMLKVILDGLKLVGVYKDDRQIDAHLMWRRLTRGKGQSLTVFVGGMDDTDALYRAVQAPRPAHTG